MVILALHVHSPGSQVVPIFPLQLTNRLTNHFLVSRLMAAFCFPRRRYTNRRTGIYLAGSQRDYDLTAPLLINTPPFKCLFTLNSIYNHLLTY